jgi:hypothetical protein
LAAPLARDRGVNDKIKSETYGPTARSKQGVMVYADSTAVSAS